MNGQDGNHNEQRVEERDMEVRQDVTPPEDTSEPRLSRKREREVSLEPSTPQAATIDLDGAHSDVKERRTPATKKNRVSAQLDVTAEEDEGGDTSPTLDPATFASPQHERKIRQISQGVEHINWTPISKQPSPGPNHPVSEEQSQEHQPMDTEASEHREDVPPLLPPLMQGENPPILTDDAGVDEHGGEADPAEVPPDAQQDGTPAEEKDVEPSPVLPTSAKEASGLSRHTSKSDVDQEGGLKRKLADRSVSERVVPEPNGDLTSAGMTKRPRDDPDSDENPRQTKRPTPPPDVEKEDEESPTQLLDGSDTQIAQSAAATSGLSGFMAYASTNSPFASVKGPSLFAQKVSWNSANSTPFSSGSQSPVPKLGSSAFGRQQTPGSPSRESSLKRTGFEAFASVGSPFASAKRSKSPTPSSSVFGRPKSPTPLGRHHTSSSSRIGSSVNPFSAYASGGVHAFSSQKRSGSGSPALVDSGDLEAGTTQGSTEDEDGDSGNERGISFSEKLRAGKDEEEDETEKVLLQEQEVYTGEEDEETIYQVRGKLFALDVSNSWKERGTGQLRLNVRREDGSGARLLMRKEAVYAVLLNTPLFKGMRCVVGQDPRYLRFSTFEAGSVTHYNLRVSNAKIASELLEEINAHIPGE